MAQEIRVPTLGESVTEATVGQWFKKSGEQVNEDEPVVELETDKVTVEVPAPVSGVISSIAVQEGETVEVGALLGAIEAGAQAAAEPAEAKAVEEAVVEDVEAREAAEESAAEAPEEGSEEAPAEQIIAEAVTEEEETEEE